MSDLLAEIDDAMRHERLVKMWQQNKKLIIGFFVLVLVATGAMSGYRQWNESVNAEQTTKLMNMLEAENFPDNVANAKQPRLRPGLQGIAWMTAAGAYLNQDKKEEALALYERIAADGSIPDDIRQLGILMSVRLRSNDKREVIAYDLQGQLEKIWKDANSPWQYHARLESAVLYAHNGEDYVKAREQLAAVMDAKGLPNTIYAKANALDHAYAIRQENKSTTTDKDS